MSVRRPALTIRAQLTLVYAISFALAATVLAVGVYLLMTTVLSPASVPPTAAAPVVSPTPPAPEPTPDAASWHGLVLAAGIALLAGVAVAGILGWVVAGRMLAPIRRITTIARETAARTLHARVSLPGPSDEIKQLADTFDDMLTRLQRAFEAQRRFAANASHELLTPLTTSRALLEVAAAHPGNCDLPVLLAQLLTVNSRSEQLVESLLELARAEHGVAEATPVDLADVATKAIRETRAEAAERSLTTDVDAAPVIVDGDPTLLGRLAVNLLHNAIRHNKPGGHILLRVAQDPGGPTLTVSNTGPMVPEELIAELFEPFVRAAPRTRGGHGLGMAIVRAVTDAHDGTVTARPNPGGGLTVTVAFPNRRTLPNAGEIPGPAEWDTAGRARPGVSEFR